MTGRRPHQGTGQRPGRRSKGDRYPHTIRFPRELYDGLTAAATAAGYGDSLSDYVVEIARRAHDAGLWPARAPGHDQLPIGA